MGTPLSILDLVVYQKGQTIADAFAATKELSAKADKWGYQRYWMAEHHGLEGVGSAATPILISFVAQNTSRIRVGSGGIMLPNHSPLIVAEQFGTLETLFPGRIDLGLGRAPGTDQQTMRAIRGEGRLRETDFGELIEQLLHYFAPAEPGQKIKAIPGAGMQIPLWILGSSLYSAHLAASMGRPYSFAAHFAPQLMMEALDIYRREFRPSAVLSKPYVMIGTAVVAAPTDKEAEFLSTTIQRRFLGIVTGDRGGDAAPVESMDGLWSPPEERLVKSMLRTMVVGGPEKVRQGLQQLIKETGADEIIITSDLYKTEHRLRSYEIIAEVGIKQGL